MEQEDAGPDGWRDGAVLEDGGSGSSGSDGAADLSTTAADGRSEEGAPVLQPAGAGVRQDDLVAAADDDDTDTDLDLDLDQPRRRLPIGESGDASANVEFGEDRDDLFQHEFATRTDRGDSVESESSAVGLGLRHRRVIGGGGGSGGLFGGPPEPHRGGGAAGGRRALGELGQQRLEPRFGDGQEDDEDSVEEVGDNDAPRKQSRRDGSDGGGEGSGLLAPRGLPFKHGILAGGPGFGGGQRGRHRVQFDGYDDNGADDDNDSQHGQRNMMLAAQLGFWGHSLVTFSTIGIGLYMASKFFNVDFERFLGMVLLGGLGMLAARPNYNPRMSNMIEHGLSEAELDTVKTFVKRRVDLNEADPSERDRYLGRLKSSSYSSLNLSGVTSSPDVQQQFGQRVAQPYTPPLDPDDNDDDLFF